MTSKPTRIAPKPASARRAIARSEIATAFNAALSETATSHEEAARAIGVAKRTIGAWVRKERSLDVESILATPRLAKCFRRALCTEHHEPLVGYVARKNKRA